MPYTAVGFLNGGGSLLKSGSPNQLFKDGTRRKISPEAALSPDYRQEAMLPRGAETHSPTDVGVYARGPWAHLVEGTMEQTVIYHIMAHAVGLGDPDDDGYNDAATTGCQYLNAGDRYDRCGFCMGKPMAGTTTRLLKLPTVHPEWDAAASAAALEWLDSEERWVNGPDGSCDCFGHVFDDCGVCGGYGKDVCGVCQGGGIPSGACDCDR